LVRFCSGPARDSSLEGNGEVVTEIRTVSVFDAVCANNGVRVVLTLDATATAEVDLEVTTDSNLQEFLTIEVTGNQLNVSADRTGGVTSTQAFDVLGSVAAVSGVSVDNGAQVLLTRSIDGVSLSADNGAQIHGEALEATAVIVDADNGAQITVCATSALDGEVTHGARLTVLCGGSVAGVETAGGGTVSSVPRRRSLRHLRLLPRLAVGATCLRDARGARHSLAACCNDRSRRSRHGRVSRGDRRMCSR
jgi:hypothetical protein